MKGSDQASSSGNILANLKTVGVISHGCGPAREDYEPIDELVDEENAVDNSRGSGNHGSVIN